MIIYDQIVGALRQWLDWRIEAVRMRNQVLGSTLPATTSRRGAIVPRPRPTTDPVTQ